jgi:hypothetical protein
MKYHLFVIIIKFETNVSFSRLDSYIYNLTNRINCSEWRKKNDVKYKLNFCYKCKDYIC